LSLATKTSYLKDGERQERTEWHRIQAWGSLGGYAASFRKSPQICVEGEQLEANASVRVLNISPVIGISDES
jgi:single-stranded DNA-binding protein